MGRVLKSTNEIYVTLGVTVQITRGRKNSLYVGMVTKNLCQKDGWYHTAQISNVTCLKKNWRAKNRLYGTEQHNPQKLPEKN